MADQKTDDNQGMSPNMDINSKSMSPKTTGEGTRFRDDGDQSESDNNGYHGRLKGRVARERSVG